MHHTVHIDCEARPTHHSSHKHCTVMAMAGWPGLTASLLVLVLLISMSLPAEAKRTIKQSDALSNSNGCLGLIPKCEQGACATRNIMGTARWVCLRCLANYEPVVDSSRQDNIVQCGE